MAGREFHHPEWYRFSALVALELVSRAKKQGLKQKDVAAAIGVTVTHMSQLVHGKRGPMTVGQLLAGSRLVGADPQAIIKVAYEDLLVERSSEEIVFGARERDRPVGSVSKVRKRGDMHIASKSGDHGVVSRRNRGPIPVPEHLEKGAAMSDPLGNLRAAQTRNVQAEHEAMDGEH